MSTHIFKLPESLETELKALVEATDLPKSYFLVEAFKSYVRDRKEMIRTASIIEKSSSGEIKLKSVSAILQKHDLALI
jgi:predicted DNA-binding protein